jgi:methyl-accepting chemotaxis protein
MSPRTGEIAPRATSGGLLRPMLSKLQQRALLNIIAFALIFLIGLAVILLYLHVHLTPELRQSILSSDGVPLAIALAALWIGGGLIAGGALVLLFLRRQVTTPVAELARLSEAVGAGQAGVPFRPSTSRDEVGRLSRATAGMVSHLRQLSSSMRKSATDATRLAEEVVKASNTVATDARRTAGTADAASQAASARQQNLIELTSGAARMNESFVALREASDDTLLRERRLREAAAENRARLNENSRALDSLTADSLASADAIAGLAAAVEEIRNFLTLVQKISRQSKLLALNAAMEAARAGEQGEGFAVVAGEVRRLAASSTEAAQRTDALVKSMIENVERAQESTSRTVSAAQGVLELTVLGRRAFTNVEYTEAEAAEWRTKVEKTISDASALAQEMSEKLSMVTRETVGFVQTIRTIAVSSDEQSRAASNIAAGASDLSSAAGKISAALSAFKLADS